MQSCVLGTVTVAGRKLMTGAHRRLFKFEPISKQTNKHECSRPQTQLTDIDYFTWTPDHTLGVSPK